MCDPISLTKAIPAVVQAPIPGHMPALPHVEESVLDRDRGEETPALHLSSSNISLSEDRRDMRVGIISRGGSASSGCDVTTMEMRVARVKAIWNSPSAPPTSPSEKTYPVSASGENGSESAIVAVKEKKEEQNPGT